MNIRNAHWIKCAFLFVSLAALADDRAEELEALVASRNGPIEFWGKTVDQDGKPIEGVRVRVSTRHWVVISNGQDTSFREDSAEQLTAANGVFHIKDLIGQDLNIELIEKESYLVSPKTRWRFGYRVTPEVFTPDVKNPVIFKLWKKRGAQELIHHGVVSLSRVGVPCDGTPVHIDLFEGRKVNDGGDLRVSLIRTPLHIERGRQKYDWVATIEAINGGVTTSDDEFMYEAPPEGFTPSFKVEMRADDPHWTAKKIVNFFVKSRDGKQYSRVSLKMTTDYEPPPTGFSFDVWLNPNGSRNLEPKDDKLTPPRK